MAAVIYHHMDFEDDVIRGGKLEVVKDWLREKVHKFGATYRPRNYSRGPSARTIPDEVGGLLGEEICGNRVGIF